MLDDQPYSIDREIAAYVGKHGAVPPPWIVFPDTHPYDGTWRMGAGECYLEVFRRWWRTHNLDEEQRIEYFRKWPLPPRWLEWMIDAIWAPQFEDGEDEQDLAFAPYFDRVEALGFGSKADYDKDLADPRWLGPTST